MSRKSRQEISISPATDIQATRAALAPILESSMQNEERRFSTLALLVPQCQVCVVLDQQAQYGVVAQFSGYHRWGASQLVLDVDVGSLGQKQADHLC